MLTDGLVRLIDGLLEKLPFVRLLYGTAKDFFEAFAGEKKRFDTAVLVTLYPASEAKALGFMTRRDVEMFGLVNHVAVYLPHSYAFTGQLILVPAEHVTLVQAGSAELMTFIVSAGVTEKSGSTFGGSTSSSNTPNTPMQAVSLMPAHGVDPAS